MAESVLNPHAIAVLLLTIVALFLFTRDRIPLETSSLLVLALLAAGFELFPYSDAGHTIHALDFFSGFGHEALVAVAALMVVGHGLARTGALEPVGRLLSRVRDTPDNLKQFESILGAELYSSDSRVDDEHPLQAEGQQLAEIIVTQGSPLLKRTLSGMRFADRYQLAILALYRTGSRNKKLMSDMANVALEIGDVLLVQGASEKITELKKEGRILVLDGKADLPHSRKAPLALAIMIAVVVLSAVGMLPIAISAVCGVLVMAITGCLGWRDVGEAINAQIVLIVAASLALGSAMLQTGAADVIAGYFVSLTAQASIKMQLSGLMLMMAILTNIVSNNAAAVIGTPIAIGIANQLGVAVEPFVLSVLFGANMSYATPMAYKTNLLVMTVGGYSFNDFLKIGIPLTLIMWVSLSLLVPLFFPI